MPSAVAAKGRDRKSLSRRLAAALAKAEGEGFESVAIAFLHADLNPGHERRAGQLARGAGFRFVSADGGRFDPATHRVTWAWNELAPGSKKTLHLGVEAVNAGEWMHKLEARDERGTRVQTEFPPRIESAAASKPTEVIEP